MIISAEQKWHSSRAMAAIFEIDATGTFETCWQTLRCLLIGVIRKWSADGQSDATDPKATSPRLKALRTRPNRRMKMANAPALIGHRDQHGEARRRLDDASILGL